MKYIDITNQELLENVLYYDDYSIIIFRQKKIKSQRCKNWTLRLCLGKRLLFSSSVLVVRYHKGVRHLSSSPPSLFPLSTFLSVRCPSLGSKVQRHSYSSISIPGAKKEKKAEGGGEIDKLKWIPGGMGRGPYPPTRRRNSCHCRRQQQSTSRRRRMSSITTSPPTRSSSSKELGVVPEARPQVWPTRHRRRTRSTTTRRAPTTTPPPWSPLCPTSSAPLQSSIKPTIPPDPSLSRWSSSSSTPQRPPPPLRSKVTNEY